MAGASSIYEMALVNIDIAAISCAANDIGGGRKQKASGVVYKHHESENHQKWRGNQGDLAAA